MSPFQSYLSAIAGVLFIAGYVPYIYAITRGETKPAKASWIIWATLDTITLVGMYAAKSQNYQILGASIGAWIVAILSFKYGKPGWKKLDILCLVAAVIGIVLWQTFSDPVLAILTSQIVIFVGSIPTFTSAWQDPSLENRTGWTLAWVSCVVALFAIPAWTLKDAAQPITFFVIESVMMYLLYLGPNVEQFRVFDEDEL